METYLLRGRVCEWKKSCRHTWQLTSLRCCLRGLRAEWTVILHCQLWHSDRGRGDDHVQTQKDKGWKLPSLKINPALRKWQFQITRWNWESDELLAKRHVSASVTCFTDGKLNQQNMLRNTVSLDITNLNKKVDFTTVSARILKYLKIVSKYNIHHHTAD